MRMRGHGVPSPGRRWPGDRRDEMARVCREMAMRGRCRSTAPARPDAMGDASGRTMTTAVTPP